jgi:hypothetical protein
LKSATFLKKFFVNFLETLQAEIVFGFEWSKFIKTSRKPQAFKPGDEWLPGGPTVFVGPQARNYGVLWSRN